MRAFAVAFAFVALAAALSLAQVTTKYYSNNQCTGTEVTGSYSGSLSTGTCVLQNISRTLRVRTTITCNGTFANLRAWREANTGCTGTAGFCSDSCCFWAESVVRRLNVPPDFIANRSERISRAPEHCFRAKLLPKNHQRSPRTAQSPCLVLQA
jgi:hypothetical protein